MCFVAQNLQRIHHENLYASDTFFETKPRRNISVSSRVESFVFLQPTRAVPTNRFELQIDTESVVLFSSK